jgi:hypothetical protein
MIRLDKKSEWFILDSPIGEPNEKWNTEDKYHIERVVKNDGSIIWFGISVNWKKELNGKWTELTINYDVKPLDKYLPDIVYGEGRMYWKECETPIYEKLYMEL